MSIQASLRDAKNMYVHTYIYVYLYAPEREGVLPMQLGARELGRSKHKLQTSAGRAQSRLDDAFGNREQKMKVHARLVLCRSSKVVPTYVQTAHMYK